MTLSNNYDLVIFSRSAVHYEDQDIRAGRLKPGVLRWFGAVNAGQIAVRAAIVWPRPEVGRRFALRQGGAPRRQWIRLPHEAKALEEAQGLARLLGLTETDVFISFFWRNPIDDRPGPTPEPRIDDPRWHERQSMSTGGLFLRILTVYGVTPDRALLVYEYGNEWAAARELGISGAHAGIFFNAWPNVGDRIKRPRIKRQFGDDIRGLL